MYTKQNYTMNQKVLLTSKEVNIILNRLACQLIEKHLDFSETILIGIQPRGTFLAKRLKRILENDYQVSNIKIGFLDITFFRDDFRRTDKPLEANITQIDFLVENKKVIFVDDVLEIYSNDELFLNIKKEGFNDPIAFANYNVIYRKNL